MKNELTMYQGMQSMPERVYKASVAVLTRETEYQSNVEFSKSNCVLMDTIWSMSETAQKESVSSDFYWDCIARAVFRMSEGGRAVVLVPTSILTSREGKNVKRRMRLLNAGLIETVFAMPIEKAAGGEIEYSLVVLNAGNSAVRMIDLSFFCIPADSFRNVIECQYGSKACSPYDVVKENSKLMYDDAVLDARILMHNPIPEPVFMTTLGVE